MAADRRNIPGFTPETYRLTGGQEMNQAASHSWNRLVGVMGLIRQGLGRGRGGES